MTTKEGADWHRTVTVRVHLTDDPATNARIGDTGAQQRAVHNRTVEHLLRDRSDEPLQKSTARGHHRPPGTMVNLAEGGARTPGHPLEDRPRRHRRRGRPGRKVGGRERPARHRRRTHRRQRRAHPAGHPAPAGRPGAPVPPTEAQGAPRAAPRPRRRRSAPHRPAHHLPVTARIGNRAMTHKKDRRRRDQDAETSERSR